MFSPNITPLFSSVRKGLVKGKKAESAWVVMFLLVCNSSFATGIIDLYPCTCLNKGMFGTIINEFNSASTFFVNKFNSSLDLALQFIHRQKYCVV